MTDMTNEPDGFERHRRQPFFDAVTEHHRIAQALTVYAGPALTGPLMARFDAVVDAVSEYMRQARLESVDAEHLQGRLRDSEHAWHKGNYDRSVLAEAVRLAARFLDGQIARSRAVMPPGVELRDYLLQLLEWHERGDLDPPLPPEAV